MGLLARRDVLTGGEAFFSDEVHEVEGGAFLGEITRNGGLPPGWVSPYSACRISIFEY